MSMQGWHISCRSMGVVKDMNKNQELLEYLMSRIERDNESLKGASGLEDWVALRVNVLKQLFEDEKLIMLNDTNHKEKKLIRGKS